MTNKILAAGSVALMGAGSLLGADQSGEANDVGVQARPYATSV